MFLEVKPLVVIEVIEFTIIVNLIYSDKYINLIKFKLFNHIAGIKAADGLEAHVALRVDDDGDSCEVVNSCSIICSIIH